MSPKVSRLDIKSSVKSLDKVREFISRAARELGFNEHAVFEIEISVYEACANIIEHAYKNDPTGLINIAVTGDEAKVVITIEDHGLSFPTDIDRAIDITKFIETRQDGGLGIYIIEACMDEISYNRADDTNVLELVKYKEHQRPSG